MVELFNNNDELRAVLTVNQNFHYEDMADAIFQAAREYVTTYFPLSEYEAIVSAHQANTLSTEQDALLPYLQRAVAKFGMFKYFDWAQIQVSTAGVFRVEKENLKSLYRYQDERIREGLLQEGWNAVEMLLDFLEQNRASYTAWDSSSEGKKNRANFINSAKEFNQHYNTRQGRWLFEQMRQLMSDVEDVAIRRSIGDTYFNELKTQIEGRIMSTANETALKYIRKAVANFTLYEAIKQNLVQLTGRGVQVLRANTMDGTPSTAPTPDQLFIASAQAQRYAADYMRPLLKLLRDNPTDYPSYTTFHESKEKEKEDRAENLRERRKSNNGSTFFM